MLQPLYFFRLFGIALILMILLFKQVAFSTEPCGKLLPIQNKDGLFGYISPTGTLVVSPRFRRAFQFSDHVGVIQIDEQSDGIVDMNGKVIVVPNINILSNFYNGVAVAEIAGKYSLINKKGEIISKIPFFVVDNEYVSSRTRFADGLAALVTTKGLVFIDTTGKVVFVENDGLKTEGFDGGLATIIYKGGFYGVVDKYGKRIISPVSPKQMSISSPSDGLVRIGKHFADVNSRPTWKYLDVTGKVVLEIAFDYAGDFKNGLAPVADRGKWGYVNREGKVIIPPSFDDVGTFSEDLAAVKLIDKFGFINANGQTIIAPRYNDVRSAFMCGVAYVVSEQLEGYVDTKGTWVWKQGD
jgi:WG containing repeat